MNIVREEMRDSQLFEFIARRLDLVTVEVVPEKGQPPGARLAQLFGALREEREKTVVLEIRLRSVHLIHSVTVRRAEDKGGHPRRPRIQIAPGSGVAVKPPRFRIY